MEPNRTIARLIERVRPMFRDEPPDVDAHAIEIVRALGQVGLLRYAVGPLHLADLCCAREGLAYHSGLADTMLAMQGLGSHPVHLAGSARQKRGLLPDTAKGKAIAAFAITEPGAGSDVGAIETRARRKGRQWRLRGTKTFTSNAGIADYYTVFARAPKGISAFVVRAPVEVQPIEVIAPHPIGRVTFDDTAAELLGAEGEGLKIAFRTLDAFRASVAAAACGLARRAHDESMRYATRRRQFGRPLAEFQATRFKVAEMATELTAARLLVARAAQLHEQGDDALRLGSAMAKLFATEAAQRIVDGCVQIHGGQGVVKGHVAERLYREVRALRIYEGTSEVLKIIIAHHLLPHA